MPAGPGAARLQGALLLWLGGNKARRQRRAHRDSLANQRLDAELRDLNEGREMIEERARREIGMLRQGEIFVQYSRSK